MTLRQFLMPLQRCVAVRITMKSGAVIRFKVSDITRGDRGNDLTSLARENPSASDPFYIRLDDISVIQTRRAWRWRIA